MHFLTSTQTSPKVRLISLTVLLLVLFSGKTLAQCGFIPGFGCSFTDYTNYGINSSNPQTLEYDNFLSAFHSTVIRNSDGVFMIWGETAASNGTSSLLIPTEINATNFPGLTGIPLKMTMGSEAVQHQKILLTSEGLFAWGSAGKVISTGIKNNTAFGKIKVNGKDDGLPTGVSPGDVKMMFASTKVLAIVTCEGSVYMLAANNKENQGDGSNLHANSWAKVKTSDTGHPDLANVVAVRGSTNTLMALTSDNEVYTWGYKTLLGDGSAYSLSARDYATRMTLPENSQIKMIGVTSYDRNHDKNTPVSNSDDPTYYILYSNKKIYATGNNDLKQLGDFTSVSKNDWVQPHYPENKVTNNPNAGDVMDDIIWISANGHDIRWPGINVINEEYRLWNWGSNAGSMLGRTSTSQDNNTNTPFDPGQPLPGGNFNPQTSNILTVETGGHTTMIIQQCEENFGYVGHAIHGSTAAGLDGDTHYPTFIFNTSTVKICGLDAVPDIAFTGNPTTTIIGDAVCRDQKIELIGEPLGGVFTVEGGPGEITNGNLLSFTGTQTSGTVKIRYTVPLSTCVNKYVERNVQFGPCAAQKISGTVWIDKNSNAIIDTGEPGTNASASGYNGLWANLILEGTTDDTQEQGCAELSVSGTTYTTAKDGDWNDKYTWVGGNKPSDANIGNNNKVVILHNVTKSGGLTPSQGSVLIIKDGGALITGSLEISKSNSHVIINYGTIHLTTGDLVMKSTTTADLCSFHGCIILDEGQVNFNRVRMNVNLEHTSIHQAKKDLLSKADVEGKDIRIWLEDGQLILVDGDWAGSSISFWRASEGQDGFDNDIPLQSSALEIDSKMNSCQMDYCDGDNVGKVLASVPVNSNGDYQLTVPAGCIYRVQITASPVAKGTVLSPDDALLPEGWLYTGNNIANTNICLVPGCEHPNVISGIIVDGGNVTGINFGIKGKPMISGTVYQDANGLNNGAVDGIKIYNSTSDYSKTGNPPLYVQMLDENNIVLKYVPVKSDGTYLITDITENNLVLQLTTIKTQPGLPATTPAIPPSWYFVGENFGIGNVSGTGINDGTGTGSNNPSTRQDGKINVVFPADGTPISKVDFGIELPPIADPKSFDMVPPGEFTVPSEASLPGFPKVDSYQYIQMTHPLLGPLTGSDPEDCPTTHSCSAGKTFTVHSINSHTKLFYDFGGITGVQEILPGNGPVEIKNFDPSKMVIYGEIGFGTPDNNFEFYYALTDAAGISGAPVPYSITTTSVLPIRILQLNAVLTGNRVDIKWYATISQNSSAIEIQRSTDGITWNTITTTVSEASTDLPFTMNKSFIDDNPLSGKNLYRLKQTDINGRVYFSIVRTVTVSRGDVISMYPNPASSKVNLKGLSGWCHIQIYDMAGRLVQADRTDKNLYEADVSRLPEGTYNLIVIDESGRITTFKLKKK